jgi:hypothetical protein
MEQLSRAEQLEQKRSYWKQQIEQWQQTGLTQAEYCRRNNLKHHRLVYWKKRYLKTETDVSFAAVELEDILDIPARTDHGSLTSEKHHGPHPDQRLLFDDKDSDQLDQVSSSDDRIQIGAHSRKKRGRKPLPADLPRIDIIHDLREDQKQCACGAELTCFGIDESPLQVLNEAGRKNTSTSYMWVFRGGSPDRPVLIYEYQRSRSGKTALAFLHDYKSYIQTDDFSGYDHLDQKPGVVHLGCWAHARRKFVKVAAVRKKHRAKRINPKSLAEQALDYIGKLYGIENQARRQELDADQIRRLRPGNNLVENAIRPFVVGRTGYLPAAPMGPRPVPPSLH